jgi:hypothetical protein
MNSDPAEGFTTFYCSTSMVLTFFLVTLTARFYFGPGFYTTGFFLTLKVLAESSSSPEFRDSSFLMTGIIGISPLHDYGMMDGEII